MGRTLRRLVILGVLVGGVAYLRHRTIAQHEQKMLAAGAPQNNGA